MRLLLRPAAVLLASVAALQVNALTTPGESRRQIIIDANIRAVQAWQILLARRAGMAPSACFPAQPDEAALQSVVRHQQHMLAQDPRSIASWADSRPTTFQPDIDLQPILAVPLPLAPALPVMLVGHYLAEEAPGAKNTSSIASLYQTVLELDRDGDLLQQLFALYNALGLPVYTGQIGLRGSDADFLASAKELSVATCATPFAASVDAWQIAGRKIWNWGEKTTHKRDASVVAGEMVHDSGSATLVHALRSLPPTRIAVLGHSYTMDQHWSSPSSFTGISAALLARVNPRVTVQHYSTGGLSSSKAERELSPAMLATHPDIALFVLMNRNEHDLESLRRMIVQARRAGIEVMLFDDVEDPDPDNTRYLARVNGLALEEGAIVVPVRAALDADPQHAAFPCMDGIHKTEPYHRVLARLWLSAIARRRVALQ